MESGLPRCCPGQVQLSVPEMQEMLVGSLGREAPWGRKWQLTPVFLPGRCNGQRSLVGSSAPVPEGWARPSACAHTLGRGLCRNTLSASRSCEDTVLWTILFSTGDCPCASMLSRSVMPSSSQVFLPGQERWSGSHSFSRVSSRLGDRTRSLALQLDSLPSEPPGTPENSP